MMHQSTSPSEKGSSKNVLPNAEQGKESQFTSTTGMASKDDSESNEKDIEKIGGPKLNGSFSTPEKEVDSNAGAQLARTNEKISGGMDNGNLSIEKQPEVKKSNEKINGIPQISRVSTNDTYDGKISHTSSTPTVSEDKEATPSYDPSLLIKNLEMGQVYLACTAATHFEKMRDSTTILPERKQQGFAAMLAQLQANSFDQDHYQNTTQEQALKTGEETCNEIELPHVSEGSEKNASKASDKLSLIANSATSNTGDNPSVMINGSSDAMPTISQKIHFETNNGEDLKESNGNSSPAIIEDERLLLTDEELPPFDCGDLAPSLKISYSYMSKFQKSLQTPPTSSRNSSQPQKRPNLQGATPPAVPQQQLAGSEKGQPNRGQQPSVKGPNQATNVSAATGVSAKQTKMLQTGQSTKLILSGHEKKESKQTRESRYSFQNNEQARYHHYIDQYNAPDGKYKYPYKGAPAASLKPIRRIAKIRPYANQTIPVSAAEILAAIPEDASSVFHIMDRRINLDSIEVGGKGNKDVNPPMYSLLRAWVQDDPNRHIPPPQPDFPSSFSTSQEKAEKRTLGTKAVGTESPKAAKKQRVDMVGFLKYNQTYSTEIDRDRLRMSLVERAKDVRKAKEVEYRKRLKETRRSLRERGIILKRR